MKKIISGRSLKPFHLLLVSVLGIMLFVGISCYRDYGLTTADYDMILTNFDPNADFSSYSTYALPDTVIHPVPEGQEDNLTREFDAQIISDVRRNMNALGYTEVDTNAANPPDVVVLIGALKSEWQVSGWYPGGWWGWYPWYPGGGWYPYYPGYGYSYSFSTGTIFIAMIDPEKRDEANNVVGTVWGGIVNGLTGDTRQATRSRITSAINQAFYQSAYYLRVQ